MPVDTKHREYVAARARWSRARDCYAGAESIKAAGITYLPALASHKGKPELYDQYAMRGVFFNATRRTVDGLSGAIHQKPPVVECPDGILEQMDDVTMSGMSLELFAQQTTREVLQVGRYGILVDMPDGSADAGAELRPYWAGYRAEDIVSWRTMRRAGDEILTRVVLCEELDEPDLEDEFATVRVTQYRVLELLPSGYQQRLFRMVKNADGSSSWIAQGATIVPTRRGVPLPFIPFVFVSPTTTSASVEASPLDDLVELNLSHWRTMVDLEHGMHFLALPTPWVSGSLASDDGGAMSIGPSEMLLLDKDGRAGMLEFTGQGLQTLERADERKRKMMATLGARLLEEQPRAGETATAVNLRHSGEQATLRTVAKSVQDGLTAALWWHDWWTSLIVDPRDSGSMIELNQDFMATRMTHEELRTWLLAIQADQVAYETFYAALERGGLTRPGVDAEEEKRLIEEKIAGDPPPPPVMMLPPPGGGDDADEDDAEIVPGGDDPPVPPPVP